MPRPLRHESERRMRRYAELVAEDDSRLDEHARTAGISPWRALRLLSDPQFRALVDGLDRVRGVPSADGTFAAQVCAGEAL